jgi:purine-binding chemotaxis protein CheW
MATAKKIREETRKLREFLTFTLGGEEYAMDILKVQEIRGYEAVTRIANTPAFIKGVINLRGLIVPIVDMRIKFNLGEPVYNEFTVTVILNLGKRVIGIVVDSVSDVISLDEQDIHPAPEFGTFDMQYLIGLAAVNDRMLILIDIERLMSSAEMALIDQTSA